MDAGNFELASGILADNISVDIPFSPDPMDKTTFKQIAISMKVGFPDMKLEVTEITEAKGSATFKAIFTGTNTAMLQGNPATGNRVKVKFLGYAKFDKTGKMKIKTTQFCWQVFFFQNVLLCHPALFCLRTA